MRTIRFIVVRSVPERTLRGRTLTLKLTGKGVTQALAAEVDEVLARALTENY